MSSFFLPSLKSPLKGFRNHLYLDLQPYVCLEPNCPGDSFATRIAWISHIALEHDFEPGWHARTCPLCYESTGEGKFAIIRHLGSHLEEISLSALPSHTDAMSSSISSISDARTMIIDCVCCTSGDIPEDKMTAMIECNSCASFQHRSCIGLAGLVPGSDDNYLCWRCRAPEGGCR